MEIQVIWPKLAESSPLRPMGFSWMPIHRYYMGFRMYSLIPAMAAQLKKVFKEPAASQVVHSTRLKRLAPGTACGGKSLPPPPAWSPVLPGGSNYGEGEATPRICLQDERALFVVPRLNLEPFFLISSSNCRAEIAPPRTERESSHLACRTWNLVLLNS